MSEFPQYEELRAGGATPVQVYQGAKAAGMGQIDAIRMLRTVFGLSLAEAKEVPIVASGVANSLREHEENLARELSKQPKE
jgi:hypothetical protein